MKNNFNEEIQIFSSLRIDVTFQDISKRLKTSKHPQEIYKIASDTLKQMKGKWKPAALIQWYDFKLDTEKKIGQINVKANETIFLNLGYSCGFLKEATHVMITAHSVGGKLDQESANASARGDLLEAYVIDIIGLVILEKISNIIKRIAEDQAQQMGWGVGPFLSPGSVHGWDLEEQSKLCKLLPIDEINVTIKNSLMLFPLKSIVALIGIGPYYKSSKVGSTCDVCSKRDNCQINQSY